MMRRLTQWLEQRTGIGTMLRSLFNEEIPASSGWPQVLGSVVLFLFLTQVFTGVLLSLNYAPTPGDAYHSLQYIMRDITGGRMIRGLHHWGASMMVIFAVLHMTQVFLYGAYRKPREVTWMVGVVLLLITLGFGLTGYLLPWDDRAYWGTVVTTQIMGQVPVLGRYIQRLVGAESGVGVVTFARFYTLHTLILPALIVTMIGLHLYLVRRHGVTPAVFDSQPKRRFFPEQAFKDVAAVFGAFAVLFVLTVLIRAPLERMADPTDSSVTPRPEWYFLFLFQTLKLFKGASEPIGSVLLPTVAVATLLAVPFLDRSKLKRVSERTVAIGIVVLCAVGWASLTTAAVMATPNSPRKEPAGKSAPADWRKMTPSELAELGQSRGASSPAPPEIVAAARIFVSSGCVGCHKINGEGGNVGPSLNGISSRRTEKWVAQHLKDPKSQSPNTVMPAFKFSDHDRDLVIKYLFSLPDR